MNHRIEDQITAEIVELNRYPESQSTQRQDDFVAAVLKQKVGGSFVEIGSNHPVTCNNTYLLEKRFGWRGLALETNKYYVDMYNNERLSTCINEDAIKFDYRKYFEENNYSNQIDYLSIDIDIEPRYANLKALLQIPLSTYRFNVITIEHGSIVDFTLKNMRDAQRLILESYGYKLVVQGWNEDFWVDADNVPSENYWTLYRVGDYF